ncbi:hypothetical protein Rsub_12341 [Raphidocelis subcapitata]|uniref:Uncharacterized protein n=1 Tax=Raphidocelis subcapitata TaxID=307507 RepID=A0A2V0PQN7_9CHLO|nr:hypothetical protein Rsub_12341 [Raphidocelis subcapitata]|eukprot:GBF99535.1 hypothetical protein Rsub_12341 [Raphidocelis subcapitata]
MQPALLVRGVACGALSRAGPADALNSLQRALSVSSRAAAADEGPADAAAEAASSDSGKQEQRGGAEGLASSSGRAPHISLDDPQLRLNLSFNASFKTDEERLYRVGMVAAMERKGRTELRKVLAANRLALRDAAAGPAALRGPSSLLDRATARLAEMEAEARRLGGTP